MMIAGATVSGNLVADVFSMIVVLVVVAVAVVAELVVVAEIVVEVFVAGKVIGAATDFAPGVLMLEETVVVEVVVEVLLVVDGDASTFFSPFAAGAGATFAGDVFFFTT